MQENQQNNSDIENKRLWTMNFTLIFLARLFAAMVFALLTAIMAAYSMTALNATVLESGLVTGIFIFSSMISRVFAGYHLDTFGRRKLLLVSGAFLVLSTTAYFLPFGIIGLLIVRCMHGILHGAFTNTVSSISVDYIPKNRLGEGLGLLAVSTTIATAIGPFVGILFLQESSYTSIFIFCSACSLLSFAMACFLRVKETNKKGDRRSAGNDSFLHAYKPFRLSDYFEPKAIKLSLAICLLSICASCMTAFIEPYSTSVGLGYAASYFFLVYSFAMGIARPLLGKFVDKIGLKIIACYSIAVFSLSFFALYVPTFSFVMIGAVFAAIGYGGFFPCCQTEIVRNAIPDRIGIATSTFFVFADAGSGIGPIIGGFLISLAGYNHTYLICALFALTTLTLFLTHPEKKATNTGHS